MLMKNNLPLASHSESGKNKRTLVKICLLLTFSLSLILMSGCKSKNTIPGEGEPEFRRWAPVPPMGWNSWDCYGPTVTEPEVKANADYMAKNLKKYGWNYIVV